MYDTSPIRRGLCIHQRKIEKETTMSKKKLDLGPLLFFAQPFSESRAGWNTYKNACTTAGKAGYVGHQAQLWDPNIVDITIACTSTSYCNERKAIADEAGCPMLEVANHVMTDWLNFAPAYKPQYAAMMKKDAPIQEMWDHGLDCTLKSIDTASNLGFDRMAAFSSGTLFPNVYKWPQHPKGLVYNSMDLLARRWAKVCDRAEEKGVDICIELHPGMNLVNGGAFKYFIEQLKKYTSNWRRFNLILDISHFILQGMSMEDILDFIEEFKDFIKMWHVKDAQFRPDAEGGAYWFFPWISAPGQFRSLGDGDADYPAVVKKIRDLGLDDEVHATLEWECSAKGIEQGICEEGPAHINAWIAGEPTPEKTAARPHGDVFDDFASGSAGNEMIAAMLGIDVSEVKEEPADWSEQFKSKAA